MMIRCIFLILCWSVAVLAADKPKICLNMIVRDEEKVIERCLASVKPFIDYWVIVDTGSLDATKEKIKTFLKDVPGELHECEWKNFEFNRNQALNLARAKGDYVMFIDADEQLVSDKGFHLPENFEKDGYLATVKDGDVEFLRMLLISTNKHWIWHGVMHETILCNEPHSVDVLKGIVNLATPDGARSCDPKKYEKDAAVLEKALVFEPANSRYMFYLAQSYANAGQYENSLKAYERRSHMGGWDQEVFWSLYSIGRLQEILKVSDDQVITSYAKAYDYRPSRAEPLARIAEIFLRRGAPRIAMLLLNEAKKIPAPCEGVFVEKNIYNYGIDLEMADAMFLLGNKEEAKELFRKVAVLETTPVVIKEAVERHLAKIETTEVSGVK